MSFTRFNFGVTVGNLQIEDDDCRPPSMPPSISQYFGDGPLKKKSDFLAKPITFDNNRIIFSFRNIDEFFDYNFYDDERVLNYGGLIVQVFFLPSSISKIDDVELNWVKVKNYNCKYYIDTTPQIQSVVFMIRRVNGNNTVDAKYVILEIIQALMGYDCLFQCKEPIK